MSLILLDRDGVINEDSDAYIKSADEWHPVPGSIAALVRLQQAGYRIAVVTNQSGIARGYYDRETLSQIHQKLTQRMLDAGADKGVDWISFSPYTDETVSACRKPNTGMLRAVANRFDVSIENMVMVGDTWGDMQAAIGAGCQPKLVRSGKGARTLAKHNEDLQSHRIPVYPDLAAVVDDVLKNPSVMEQSDRVSSIRSAPLWLLMLRSAAFYAGYSILTVLMGLLAPLLFLLPFHRRRQLLGLWTPGALFWLRVTCGLTVKFTGTEHLDHDRASLLMANHQSAWETMGLQLLHTNQTWILKKELFWIPFFGWMLAMTRPIAIDRSKGMSAIKKLAQEGKDRLNQGIWVVIFPEGTRQPAGQLGDFKIGGAMMAQQTGAPVYAIAHNAGVFWPKGKFIKYPGTIEVHISPPLDTAGKSAKEINQMVQQWIETHLPTQHR